MQTQYHSREKTVGSYISDWWQHQFSNNNYIHRDLLFFYHLCCCSIISGQ
jgi:hypothetical protein